MVRVHLGSMVFHRDVGVLECPNCGRLFTVFGFQKKGLELEEEGVVIGEVNFCPFCGEKFMRAGTGTDGREPSITHIGAPEG